MSAPFPHTSVRAVLPLLAILGACIDVPARPADPEDGPEPDSAPTETRFQGQMFERNVVFLTPRSDSLILVPWLLAARTRPGGVDRTARGYLARSGAWEPFLYETWSDEPTRTPWRVVPRGGMRLVVGEGDVLTRLIFEEGPRQLEVTLDEDLVDWGGQRGESFRLLEGSVILANQRVPGLVLDMSRAYRTSEAPGGWALLASGDSLQAVLHSPLPRDPGAAGAWRGWARLGFRSLQWTAVTVDWSETRAFERARRDIPVSWDLSSADRDLEGSLQVDAVHVEAGEGDGPQLPVEALFQVSGTLRVEGGAFPVRGFFHHVQR